MNDVDRALNMRRRIIDDWRWRRLSWQEITYKYGISKAWFYRLRKRFIKSDYEGLKDRVRDDSNRPHAIGWQDRLRILNYVYDNPTHGPDRIARELVPGMCAKTVWNMLKKEDLNTRRKRRIWAHHQGKPVLSKKEEASLNARYNHVESTYPGELVSIDTFCVNVKNFGKIWQYTACDTYSSYGWARLYPVTRNSDTTIDFLEYILERIPKGKIKRILTDQGTEFYSARSRKTLDCINDLLKKHGIKHTVTKVAHPWTNGYAERLNQTIWQEFYLCRLDKPYQYFGQLRRALEDFMRYYNFKRRHTGYKLVEGGYEFPAYAFFDTRESQRCIEIKY